MERAPQLFEQPKSGDPQEERIAELERMVGRMTVELDVAKKVFGHSIYRTKENG
jgi:transposase